MDRFVSLQTVFGFIGYGVATTLLILIDSLDFAPYVILAPMFLVSVTITYASLSIFTAMSSLIPNLFTAVLCTDSHD